MVSLDMKGKWPPRWPCTVVQKTHTAAYRWRWIFLSEGIVTVILGISCFFLLIDSPALSGKWLEPDEIRFLELQRFIKDGGKFQEERANFRWKDLKMVLCNWRLYMQAYILLCISACSYGMLHEEN
jgi:sugar phosphate permease